MMVTGLVNHKILLQVFWKIKIFSSWIKSSDQVLIFLTGILKRIPFLPMNGHYWRAKAATDKLKNDIALTVANSYLQVLLARRAGRNC